MPEIFINPRGNLVYIFILQMVLIFKYNVYYFCGGEICVKFAWNLYVRFRLKKTQWPGILCRNSGKVSVSRVIKCDFKSERDC